MGKNCICELLDIRYPIIQAPMNWVSGADIVAAVSNAGGLGTLGPNSGADSITADVELTGERMRDQIKKARRWLRGCARCPGRPGTGGGRHLHKNAIHGNVGV